MALEKDVAEFELALLKDKRTSQPASPGNASGYYRDPRNIYVRLDETLTDLLVNDTPYSGSQQQQESLFTVYYTLLTKLIGYSPDKAEYKQRIDFCENKVREYSELFSAGRVAPTDLLIPRSKRFSLVHKLLHVGKRQLE